MTDKEKIKAEIERLFEKAGESLGEYRNGAEHTLITLNDFIDSLPEESVSNKLVFKSIPRLLEMVVATDRAKAYTAKLADTLESEGYHTDAKIVRESIKIMNGEKVAMATMDKEPVSDDLEEAAVKAFKQIVDSNKNNFLEILKAGAQWQKEQMLKQSVNGKVIARFPLASDPFYDDVEIYLNFSKGLSEGDKVKAIILKDE